MRDGCLQQDVQCRPGAVRAWQYRLRDAVRDGRLQHSRRWRGVRKKSCLRDVRYNHRCNSDPKDFE